MKHLKNSMVLVGLTLIFSGCANGSNSNILQSYFNKADFTGLLGFDGAKNIKLDDDLTLSNGDDVHIVSCAQVNSIDEDNVADSQYNRYKLFKINCRAAKQYLSGVQATKSFFEEQSLSEIVSKMPASVVPDLGGNSLTLGKGKTLSAFNYPFKITRISKDRVKTILKNDIHVTYILMARRDINNDGTEDVILRMDWSIPNTFGSGSSIVALTKESKRSSIKELWRY